MKKPKSREKRIADQNRGRKRSLRLKESRVKVAKRRQALIDKRAEDKRKYDEFMKKILEARMKGEF